jgi:hypothetical protein
MNKKAVGPIVGIGLLLVVVVGLFFYFQNWFINYEEDYLSEHGSMASAYDLDLVSINENALYVKNYMHNNVLYDTIFVGDRICSVTGNLSVISITTINLTGCVLNLVENESTKVTLITNVGRIEESMMYYG